LWKPSNPASYIDMKQFLFLSSTLIIFNFTSGQNKSQSHLNTTDNSQIKRLNIDTSKIAIFNLKSDRWLNKKFDSSKSFALTVADINAIDELFKKCVTENNIDTSYFHYKRQYIPFIDKKGNKKVWINCFCSDFGNDFPHWKKTIAIVSDGGSCFFNFLINLSDNSFSNLEVNGVG